MSASELDQDHLLGERLRSDFEITLGRCRRVDGPFPLFEVANGFNDAIYRRLVASFPNLGNSWQTNTDFDPMKRTGTYDREFLRVLEGNKIWFNLTKAVMSIEFKKMFCRFLFDHLLAVNREGKLLNSKMKRFLDGEPEMESFLDFMMAETVTSFSFLQMGPNDFNSPHVDAPGRVANLLMYFPQPGWRTDWGGGTHFFEFPNDVKKEPWYSETSNARVGVDAIKKFSKAARAFHTSQFVDNAWCFFIKTFDAYHSVSPIHCPEGRSRNIAAYSVALDRMF